MLGGVIALCGALSYAELAAALPRSGGEYNFLSQIYHPALGFMAGFVSVAVGFSAPIALAAIALGKYLAAALPGLQAGPMTISAVLLQAVLLGDTDGRRVAAHATAPVRLSRPQATHLADIHRPRGSAARARHFAMV